MNAQGKPATSHQRNIANCFMAHNPTAGRARHFAGDHVERLVREIPRRRLPNSYEPYKRSRGSSGPPPFRSRRRRSAARPARARPGGGHYRRRRPGVRLIESQSWRINLTSDNEKPVRRTYSVRFNNGDVEKFNADTVTSASGGVLDLYVGWGRSRQIQGEYGH